MSTCAIVVRERANAKSILHNGLPSRAPKERTVSGTWVAERGRRPPVVGSSISVSEATALYKGNEPPTPSMGLGKGRAHREAVHQCWTLHWIDELVEGRTASPASWETPVLRGCAKPMHLLPSHAGCG
jgi:hypothetical protein